MSGDSTICIYCQQTIVNKGMDGWWHKHYRSGMASAHGVSANYDYHKRCHPKILFWKSHAATPVPTSGLDQYYREVVWRANGQGRWKADHPLGPGALNVQPAVIYEDDYEPPPPPPSTLSTGYG